MDANTPDENDRLNMSGRWVKISFFNSFKMLVGRLFGPVDLSLFNEDIIKFNSFTSVGVMYNDASLGWWRNSSNNLFENLILVFLQLN